jgi:5-methylcytosine-specific restriction endonuclease McrA
MSLRDQYIRFLKSPRWAELSREVRIRDGHRCVLCGHDWVPDLVAHHRTYKYGWDDLDSIICVCRECHEILHGG